MEEAALGVDVIVVAAAEITGKRCHLWLTPTPIHYTFKRWKFGPWWHQDPIFQYRPVLNFQMSRGSVKATRKCWVLEEPSTEKCMARSWCSSWKVFIFPPGLSLNANQRRNSYFVIEKNQGVPSVSCQKSNDSILWNVVCVSSHIWLQRIVWALTNGVKGIMIYSVWVVVVFCCGLHCVLLNGAPVSLSETKHE